jgi:hypothetical protein
MACPFNQWTHPSCPTSATSSVCPQNHRHFDTRHGILGHVDSMIRQAWIGSVPSRLVFSGAISSVNLIVLHMVLVDTQPRGMSVVPYILWVRIRLRHHVSTCFNSLSWYRAICWISVNFWWATKLRTGQSHSL